MLFARIEKGAHREVYPVSGNRSYPRGAAQIEEPQENPARVRSFFYSHGYQYGFVMYNPTIAPNEIATRKNEASRRCLASSRRHASWDSRAIRC